MEMCGHYLVDPVACTPAAGWEKGQAENQVGLVRERFFAPRLRMPSYEELNAWLLDRRVAYAKGHKHPELPDQTIWQAFEAERPQLVPIASPFDGLRGTQAAVLWVSSPPQRPPRVRRRRATYPRRWSSPVSGRVLVAPLNANRGPDDDRPTR
jgi:hypothetical protein